MLIRFVSVNCDDDIGLDDIKCSGMPNHKLMLKVGVPIMLL